MVLKSTQFKSVLKTKTIPKHKMQRRLLSLKLPSNLSKNLSDLSSSSSSSILHSHQFKSFTTLSRNTQFNSLISSFSSFTTTQQPPHFFFSNFTSLKSWLSHHTVSKFLSNPLVVKQFLSNAHYRVPIPSNGFVGFRVLFLRAQFPRKIFGFNFDSARRSWFPRLTSSDPLLGLIIANVAVFLLWRIADHNFMMKNFTLNPEEVHVGISLDNFKSGRVHTMITSAFSHVDLEHIISNMIGLYFFGASIGRTFGPEYLLKLYLAGAIGGSVFYLLHHAYMAQTLKSRGWSTMDPSKASGLGASGAVNAIMLLNIFLFPKATLYLDFIIPVPAMLLGVFLIGKDMLRIVEGDSRISGSAHLGGAVVAAIAWARIRKGIF